MNQFLTRNHGLSMLAPHVGMRIVDRFGGQIEAAALSRSRDRMKIPEQYKWKTADLFSSEGSWRAAKEELMKDLPHLETYRGSLHRSASVLLECLSSISIVSKGYSRLYVYASLNSDIDMRESGYLAMVQEMVHLGSEIASRTAYVQPEILAMGRETVEAFLRSEAGLQIYRHDLYDILRRKEHTGSEGEERIVAEAGLMADGPDNIYGIFSNAEFPYPSVTLSDGATVLLDKAAFSLYRSAPGRNDRKEVFKAYFNSLNEFRRTFGAQLYAEVKKNLFYRRARRYSSCLQSALDRSNIPVDVYTQLISNVNRHLPTFHRYLRLRQRMLGVDRLHYFDLYAPIVETIDLEYTYEEAKTLVLDSVAPLGPEYQRVVHQAFSERWLDVFPSEGKRSGAYSNGAAYDVHPYVLLNFNGKYDDVNALAHELGHTVHSYLTNTHQPYPTSHYSIFVAEVASTLNEALLFDHMLKTVTDDAVRLSLLGNYLDGLRATVFRQTQFAEFELRIHEMADAGETLTGDGLNALYDNLTKRYYGHDQGVCVVDDPIGIEWANVPHFYYNFYVFQYATSFTASVAISQRLLAGDEVTTRSYLRLLSSGGSDYPVALLKQAGVDMTSPDPFERTMSVMNGVMDEIERIVAEKG